MAKKNGVIQRIDPVLAKVIGDVSKKKNISKTLASRIIGKSYVKTKRRKDLDDIVF